MPKLVHLNCKIMVDSVLPHRWLIRLTTPADHIATDELKLDGDVGQEFTDKGKALGILAVINNRANQIRNPAGRRTRS